MKLLRHLTRAAAAATRALAYTVQGRGAVTDGLATSDLAQDTEPKRGWWASGRPKPRQLGKELLIWYPVSAPMLVARVPIIYAFNTVVPLWAAIILEFIVERPVFFLLAREIHTRVELRR